MRPEELKASQALVKMKITGGYCEGVCSGGTCYLKFLAKLVLAGDINAFEQLYGQETILRMKECGGDKYHKIVETFLSEQ